MCVVDGGAGNSKKSKTLSQHLKFVSFFFCSHKFNDFNWIRCDNLNLKITKYFFDLIEPPKWTCYSCRNNVKFCVRIILLQQKMFNENYRTKNQFKLKKKRDLTASNVIVKLNYRIFFSEIFILTMGSSSILLAAFSFCFFLSSFFWFQIYVEFILMINTIYTHTHAHTTRQHEQN